VSETVISRKDVRKEIASGLATALSSLVVAVYDHQKPVEAGLSPCVRVFGLASQRPIVPATGRRSRFRFNVQAWVLAYDRNGAWTEEDAEDRLDDIEQAIAAWFGDNQLGHLWTAIEYAGFSAVSAAVIEGGESYLVEDIPIEVQVYG
jgi:hypothetical protein